MAYDDIAREDHSYNATRKDRSRNERSWRLVLHAEGAQGQLDQRDDYGQEKETCKKKVQGACSNRRMRKRTISSTTASPTKVQPAV